MNDSIRQKKVARLIQDTLSRSLIEIVRDTASGLVSITRVHMTKDLRSARVFISVFGDQEKKNHILSLLNEKKGMLRKSIATKTKLKYNPMLIFFLDPRFEHEERIDEILHNLNKDDT